MVTKDLQVNDKIIFIVNGTMIDGEILEKNYLDKGDIDFVIKVANDKITRIKHRNLNLYYKLK
jgi:hypothetical protein